MKSVISVERVVDDLAVAGSAHAWVIPSNCDSHIHRAINEVVPNLDMIAVVAGILASDFDPQIVK